MIPAGAGALALSELLDLPDVLAVPLTLAGLAAPLVVKRLDRPANALEATFRPSYAPKLIALGTTAFAPLAAALVGYRGGLAGLLEAVAVEGLGRGRTGGGRRRSGLHPAHRGGQDLSARMDRSAGRRAGRGPGASGQRCREPAPAEPSRSDADLGSAGKEREAGQSPGTAGGPGYSPGA